MTHHYLIDACNVKGMAAYDNREPNLFIFPTAEDRDAFMADPFHNQMRYFIAFDANERIEQANEIDPEEYEFEVIISVRIPLTAYSSTVARDKLAQLIDGIDASDLYKKLERISDTAGVRIEIQ